MVLPTKLRGASPGPHPGFSEVEMEAGSYVQGLVGFCGRWLLRKVNRVLNLFGFFIVCLKTAARYWRTGRRLLLRSLVQQVYFTGVESLELTFFIALLVGGLVVIQGIAQLSRVGSREALATLLTVVIIREVGPLLTAVIVILRSGSAIAIEMGYMTVLHEIESIEMQGISPLHLLAVPRLLGVTVAVICLFVFFDVVAIFGGFVAAWSLIDISLWSLLDDVARALSAVDLIVGSVKALLFGVTISLICLYHGYKTEEAITGIPPRVSRALVDCFIFCTFFNVLVSAFFYL